MIDISQQNTKFIHNTCEFSSNLCDSYRVYIFFFFLIRLFAQWLFLQLDAFTSKSAILIWNIFLVFVRSSYFPFGVSVFVYTSYTYSTHNVVLCALVLSYCLAVFLSLYLALAPFLLVLLSLVFSITVVCYSALHVNSAWYWCVQRWTESVSLVYVCNLYSYVYRVYGIRFVRHIDPCVLVLHARWFFVLLMAFHFISFRMWKSISSSFSTCSFPYVWVSVCLCVWGECNETLFSAATSDRFITYLRKFDSI